MSARPRICIFGASEGGRRARRFFGRTVEVVAFFDNDAKKHGTSLDGIPVRNPADLSALAWDRMVIASMYDEAIFQQLLQLGVPVTRVDVLDRSVLVGDDDPPRGCWLVLTVASCLVLAAGLLVWLT